MNGITGERNSFLVYVPIVSDNTATTLSITALLAYPVQAVLLSFSYKFRRLLNEKGHTVAVFLPLNDAISRVVQHGVVETERSSNFSSLQVI